MSNKKFELLGREFNSEEEAKEFYKDDLRKRLPELKKIEGYPIGEDEDILKLSDPPFYTACPNPYINDFIEQYGKPYDEETDDYHREPYLDDVIEGKNDSIYLAHTYHTKVPPKAIQRYVEHFTDKNDIIADFFCGSGMTGVAAQFSKRKAIISDLAPIASFISRCFNKTTDIFEFTAKAKNILYSANEELGKYYKTEHDGTDGGIINYVVWSEVLMSPYANEEFVYYDVAYDKAKGELLDLFNCPFSGAQLVKRDCPKVFTNYNDPILGTSIRQQKFVPVLINYSYNKKTYSRKPLQIDLDRIEEAEKNEIPYWVPTDILPLGEKTGEPIRAGFTHIHHLYFRRVLFVISKIYDEIKRQVSEPHMLSLLTSVINRNLYKGNRYVINKHNPNGRINGPLSGTMFIPPLIVEQNPMVLLNYKIKSLRNMFLPKGDNKSVLVSTQSATVIKNTQANSIDYIFTDPPFGANIMYSELNIIWEAWLKIKTNNLDEAIINRVQQKGLEEYHLLMFNTFKEYYRVLKPKRWITVEFHNSKSSVWNKIQEALSKAGFIVANVKILDKKKGTINQSYIHGTVKSDLVISAYKPSKKFEENFLKKAGEGLEMDFINEFLHQQPIQPILERTEKMLYSKMLSYYIQHGYEINYDAKVFYQLLKENFTQEDGFWFNASQINSYLEYKKKMKLDGIDEIGEGAMMMFVNDEKSALVWLHNFLDIPKTFSDIHTAFTQLANIQNDEVPDLKDLLEQNFIEEDGLYRRPQTDSEHTSTIDKREKQLMRQFESLLIQAQTEKKKIKSIRKESVQLGFENCYKQKRFDDIISLSKKLDKKILEENAELKEFVDAAEIMLHGLS